LTAVVLSAAMAQPPGSLWDGVYTDEQSRRGEALYGAQCASCHGDDLAGGGTESAPTLAGGKFRGQWDGRTLADLFDRTFATMPQDAPGSLTREQHADILAFVLARNGFPSGARTLPSAAEALKAIRFVATRP
jgi:mono/diheme cytochrome c family protein